MRKIVIFCLAISLNMCFGCSKEQSHRDSSFQYPQDMFWLRNKKNNFQLQFFSHVKIFSCLPGLN